MYYLLFDDGCLMLLGDRKDVIKYYRFSAQVLEGSFIAQPSMKDCDDFFFRHFDYHLVKLRNLPTVTLDDPHDDTDHHEFEKWG